MSAEQTIVNHEPGAQASKGWNFVAILRNASYLVVAQGATRIAGFAYVLVLARFLPEADFGLLNLALSVLLIADMLADLGLSRLVIRELSRDEAITQHATSRLLALKAMLSLATYAAIMAATFAVGSHPAFLAIMACAGLSLLPSGLATILEGVLHAQQRFGSVSMARGCLSLAQAGFGVAILMAGGDVVGITASFVLSYAAFAAFLAWTLTRGGLRLRFVFDWAFARTWLLAALPFSVVGVVFVLNVRIEFLVLGWFSDPAAVAVYGMAIKVVEATLLATIALGTALTPMFARLYVESREKLVSLYIKSLGFVFLATVPAALLAVVVGPPCLRMLLPASYDAVGPLLHIMFAGFPLWVGYYLNASLLLGTDRQQRSTAVLVALAIGQFAVSLALVPWLGATGAAIAFAASGALAWCGTAVYVARLLGTRGRIRQTTLRPIIGGAFAFAAVLVGGDWLLPVGLAVFAAIVLTSASVRALILPRR